MTPADDISTATTDAASTPTEGTSATPSSTPSPASEPTPGSTSEDSSKQSMLDAVLKVVPATNETDVLAEQTGDSETTDEDQPADGQAEADPDDDKEPPAEAASPVIRKKISKLLKQRRELRQQVEQLATLRRPAEVGQQLENYAVANDLSAEDITGILQIAAHLRHGDYAEFYKAVAPYVRTAQEYLGHAIPKDLRERVQKGEMTEATAKEFARTRMDMQRGEIQRETAEEASARNNFVATQNRVETSVAALESRMAASDPDYKAKQGAVRRTAQAMLFERGGTIASVEEALEITKAAYAEVNATIRKQRPNPTPTSKIPNGNGSTHTVRAEPKTLMEAALQGLANSRNGAHP